VRRRWQPRRRRVEEAGGGGGGFIDNQQRNLLFHDGSCVRECVRAGGRGRVGSRAYKNHSTTHVLGIR